MTKTINANTVEEAIAWIVNNEDIAKLLTDIATEDDVISTHFGLGMYLRNNLGLWDEGNPIKKDAAQYYKKEGWDWPIEALENMHTDDVSHLIITLAWKRLKKKIE